MCITKGKRPDNFICVRSYSFFTELTHTPLTSSTPLDGTGRRYFLERPFDVRHAVDDTLDGVKVSVPVWRRCVGGRLLTRTTPGPVKTSRTVKRLCIRNEIWKCNRPLLNSLDGRSGFETDGFKRRRNGKVQSLDVVTNQKNRVRRRRQKVFEWGDCLENGRIEVTDEGPPGFSCVNRDPHHVLLPRFTP